MYFTEHHYLTISRLRVVSQATKTWDVVSRQWSQDAIRGLNRKSSNATFLFSFVMPALLVWTNVCSSWKEEIIAQILLPVLVYPRTVDSLNKVFMVWIHYFRQGFKSGWVELTACMNTKQEHLQVTTFTVSSPLSPHGAFGTFSHCANDAESWVKKTRLPLVEITICLLVQFWKIRMMSSMTGVIHWEIERDGCLVRFWFLLFILSSH